MFVNQKIKEKYFFFTNKKGRQKELCKKNIKKKIEKPKKNLVRKLAIKKKLAINST